MMDHTNVLLAHNTWYFCFAPQGKNTCLQATIHGLTSFYFKRHCIKPWHSILSLCVLAENLSNLQLQESICSLLFHIYNLEVLNDNQTKPFAEILEGSLIISSLTVHLALRAFHSLERPRIVSKHEVTAPVSGPPTLPSPKPLFEILIIHYRHSMKLTYQPPPQGN